MVQRSDSARLALEVSGKLLFGNLDRDDAIKASVTRFPGLAHVIGPDGFERGPKAFAPRKTGHGRMNHIWNHRGSLVPEVTDADRPTQSLGRLRPRTTRAAKFVRLQGTWRFRHGSTACGQLPPRLPRTSVPARPSAPLLSWNKPHCAAPRGPTPSRRGASSVKCACPRTMARHRRGGHGEDRRAKAGLLLPLLARFDGEWLTPPRSPRSATSTAQTLPRRRTAAAQPKSVMSPSCAKHRLRRAFAPT